MKTFLNNWHLIYTRPKQEKKVFAELDDLKITSYLPLTKTVRIWANQKRMIESPLFPSYVFIYLRDIQDYYDSLAIDGVLQYVRVGSEIAYVHEQIVNNLKLLLTNTNKEEEIRVSADYFMVGQKVVIKEGPFTGVICEIVEHEKGRKILVRLNLLQRIILMTIKPHHLIAASPFGYEPESENRHWR